MKTAMMVLALLCSCCEASSPLSRIEMGQEAYAAAEQAKTTEERQRLLNDALAIYLAHAKDHPSGMLLTNIGNIYFSLGDFGMAICYYRRAAMLMPRNPLIQKNLQAAISRADVAHLQQERPFADAVGLRWCSPLERTAFAIGAIAVTLVVFSLNLWLPGFGFSWLWRIAASITALLLSALVWYALFIPPQAVIIKATPLRASSETAFTEPSLTTMRPGEVVEVLGGDAQLQWVRVKTAAQTTGYLPGHDLCFLNDPQKVSAEKSQ